MLRKMSTNIAVFFDRDGVLVSDFDLLTLKIQLRLFLDVADALSSLSHTNLLLIVVTNQTVISRGLATEAQVAELNVEIRNKIARAGGPLLDAFYVCPHHPNATLPEYRKVCDCRKPRPGMLLQAAKDWNIDLKRSFMVGDRITDVIAGARAGCRTVLLRTGAHLAPPIETAEELDLTILPDYTCDTLSEAARWILENSCEP